MRLSVSRENILLVHIWLHMLVRITLTKDDSGRLQCMCVCVDGKTIG